MHSTLKMKVLIIIAHPRKTSMTHQVKDAFEKGLLDTGHQVDTLDLYEIGFDPVMKEQDEPDWSNPTQRFSDDIHFEMERLAQYDALVFAFPLYWSSTPAILKGYIDRVLNLGFAYGPDAKLNFEKILWLTVAAATPKQMAKNDHGKSIEHIFNAGIANFCGVEKSKTALFLETRVFTPRDQLAKHIDDAYQEGLTFQDW